jgi:hypothetical protein
LQWIQRKKETRSRFSSQEDGLLAQLVQKYGICEMQFIAKIFLEEQKGNAKKDRMNFFLFSFQRENGHQKKIYG